MRQLARALFIALTLLRFGIDDLALSGLKQRWVRVLARVFTIGRRFDEPRGVRLRRALEKLGPIFVKFGQVLSTRRDLLPADIADELAQLQDNVPPFPGAQSVAIVERAFGKPLTEVFTSFDAEPVASASIAQVHFAVLKNGREVAVKVLRPGMLRAIDDDMALLRRLAQWVERTGDTMFAANTPMLRAEWIVAGNGDLAEAERLSLEALAGWRAYESPWMQLRSGLLLGEIAVRSGDKARARARLAAIVDGFHEGFETRRLREARRLLGELAAP